MTEGGQITVDAGRAMLTDLGERRRRHDAEGVKLAQEIREALEATDGVVPLTEAADLLGIHRTTLYRVYKPN